MNLLKYSLLLFILGMMPLQEVLAQRPFRAMTEEKKQEIEQIKKEFIAERINLKPEQAANFWEVYEQYIEEKLKLKQQTMELYKNNENLTNTDADLEKNIDQMFVLQQQELDLDKASKQKLLKVINIRQLAELYRSEKEFIRRLLHTLRENRGRGSN